LIARGPRSALLGAALVLILSGCAPKVEMATRGTPSRTLLRCADSGGTLQARGRAQQMICVHQYSDAGKSCSSRSDCQGRCIAEPSENGLPKLGVPATGRCEPDNKLFGCYAEVDGGKAKAAICVD
jgi:hypothetical protein